MLTETDLQTTLTIRGMAYETIHGLLLNYGEHKGNVTWAMYDCGRSLEVGCNCDLKTARQYAHRAAKRHEGKTLCQWCNTGSIQATAVTIRKDDRVCRTCASDYDARYREGMA